MPDARFLERFAPVTLGAAIGVAVLGGLTAPTLDQQAPRPSFVDVEDELIEGLEDAAPSDPGSPDTAPPVTVTPPADIATALLDLTPHGLTALPSTQVFGPLDAESAALLDGNEDGQQPTVEALATLLRLAGFTRGHGIPWQRADGMFVATLVYEFEDAAGAEQYAGALTELLSSDPLNVTADAAVDGADGWTARVEDEEGVTELFLAHVARGARIYRIVVVGNPGVPVDIELGRAVLAEQAAVG